MRFNDVEGDDPHAILYDPAGQELYTFNGRSEDVSVIDPLKTRVAAIVAVLVLEPA